MTADPVTATQVNLTWADVAGEEGFKVERKLASSSTWSQIGITAANVDSYTDTNSGLTGGTSYHYRVRAYTTAGNSGYSNIANATTPFPSLSPGDVVLYAAEASVRVGSWSPVADASAAGGSRLSNAERWRRAPLYGVVVAHPLLRDELQRASRSGVSLMDARDLV